MASKLTMPTITAILVTAAFVARADDFGPGRATHGPPWSNASPSDSKFINVSGDALRGSNLVGLHVYNTLHQDVGTIKDVVFNESGIEAYILASGGLLGFGNHYVAVRSSMIVLTHDAGASSWHAAMDVGADQIKAAPPFTY